MSVKIEFSQKVNVYKAYWKLVPFFPQMRPEKKAIAVSEEAKLILGILKEHSGSALNDIKVKAELSNKKWDKAVKELTKNSLAKVSKTENGLIVEAI